MGGRKARLVVRGRSLLADHVKRMCDAGCREVIIAVHPDDVALSEHAVISTAPDAAGSLRVALAHAQYTHDVVVVTPVDAVPVRAYTLAALVERRATLGALAVVPTYDGTGGHPVVVARSALVALEAHESLRALLRSLGAIRVPVDDPRVITDLDTPSDVLTHTGKAPVFLV